ncbi:MAG: hypothetical protein ACR2RV_03605, partial [Verrucomicrobiales bacterium]
PGVVRVGVFQHHGELVNMDNPEFGLFFRILENQHFDCCAVSPTDRMWADFDSLLIGVPTSKMPMDEIQAIREFIGNGGRVLALLSFGGDTAPHGNPNWESNIGQLNRSLMIDDMLVIEKLPDGGFTPVVEYETRSSVPNWSETYHFVYGTGLYEHDSSDEPGMFLSQMRIRDGRLVGLSPTGRERMREEFFTPRKTLDDSRLIVFGAAYSFSDEWLGEVGNIQLLNELLIDWSPQQIENDCERRMAEPQRHRLLHGYPMAPMMAAVDTGHHEEFVPCPERKLIVGVLPHPFCNPKLTGCGFCVFPHESFQASLARAAVRDTITEIRRAAEITGRRKVGALYFGGGTANLTPVEEFRELCMTLVECFDLKGAEISLEGVPIYFLAKKQALLDILQETRRRTPSSNHCGLRTRMNLNTKPSNQMRAYSSSRAIFASSPDHSLPRTQATRLPTRPFRQWLHHCMALLVFVIGQQIATPIHAAAGAADPYDTIYDVITTRHGSDGTAYAKDESSPTIYSTSEFPFGDKTYDKFTAALDAFAALPQERIEAYSDVQRALLQLHLWKVFDASHGKRSHPHRRAALQPKIASLMQRLALTRAEIMKIPSTRVATLESGGFAQCHDAKDPFLPFLPADLYSDESSWICLGDDEDPIPAHIHTVEARWRTLFLTFMRLPGGRTTTLQFLKDLEKRTGGRSESFPVGTQFALIEQAFLISDKGEQVLSPLIVSIALRAYLDVDRKFRKAGPPTQSVAEFVMQPRQLINGTAVMRALNLRDHRYETGEGFFPPGHEDPFESGRMLRHTRLNTCMGCHSGRGIDSIQTVINVGYSHFSTERGPKVVREATAERKREDETWKTLSELWR